MRHNECPPRRDAEPPTLQPGVSRELARWRAERYRDLAYELAIAIDADAIETRGRLTVGVTLPDPPCALILDWRGPAAAIGEVQVNGVDIDAAMKDGTLCIDARHLRADRNAVSLRFASALGPAGTPVIRYCDPDDGAVYVYTLFVPADASALFPCCDQPNLKARFRLALDLPDGWTAVSCAPGVRAGPGRIVFAATPPLPSYAFAFAAGPFATIADPAAGVPTQAYVRRSQAAGAQRDIATALQLARDGVDWHARFFNAPHPFGKHDLVLLPDFPFGGMEHAGALFLKEDMILAPADATTERVLQRRAHLVLHETAHQWLGDSVTMRWFDDLWLKEGFANLCAALAEAAICPALQPWLAFHRLKTSAVRLDATAGAVPVRQPLDRLADAKSLYGAAVYGKAPAILRQAQHLLTHEVFARGVRELVRRHACGAADADDLADALSHAAGRPLHAWLREWTERPGAPTVRIVLVARDRCIASAHVEQHDGAGLGRLWTQRLEVVAVETAGPTRRTSVLLDRASVPLPDWTGRPIPRIAFANAGDWGYGRFLLDAASREAVLEGLGSVPDALLRLQLIEALWESVRDAEIAPARFIEFALRQRLAEREAAIADTLLEHARSAAERYLAPVERARFREALEDAGRAVSPRAAVAAEPARQTLLAAAASCDPAMRARAFDAFVHDASLPDRWIEEAVVRFNAIDSAEHSRPFLRPALEALPRLQQDRRVFFVNRWLAAFLGGQSSAEALAEVERFLAETPLAHDLRMKVLEHADELARTVRIRELARAARIGYPQPDPGLA